LSILAFGVLCRFKSTPNIVDELIIVHSNQVQGATKLFLGEFDLLGKRGVDKSLKPITNVKSIATTWKSWQAIIALPIIVTDYILAIQLFIWLRATSMVLPKGELEFQLKEEHRLIQDGVLKDDSPLDKSDEFGSLCLACRVGDLKGCQEAIATGVNINARDSFDNTPLILVSRSHQT